MKTQTNQDATLSIQGTGDTVFHRQLYKYLETPVGMAGLTAKGKKAEQSRSPGLQLHHDFSQTFVSSEANRQLFQDRKRPDCGHRKSLAFLFVNVCESIPFSRLECVAQTPRPRLA